MKRVFFLSLILVLFYSSKAQKWAEVKTPLKLNPYMRADSANVFFNKKYTLFDLITNEPIYPINKNGTLVYQIYFSSNEDPRPYFGEFTPEQLSLHLFYKFKNRENCMRFCDSKWHWSNGTYGFVIMDENNFSNMSASRKGNFN
jgi:hypothetical protein